VVYGIRTKRKEGPFKRLAYHFFYRMLRRLATLPIPLDAGDFCVMSRRVVDALNQLPERSRFIRGLRTWVGFRQTGFTYEREARCAGEPKYTLARLIRLALDGVINFSQRPLQFSMWLGTFLGLLALVLAGVFLVQGLLNWTILGFNPREAVGWTSLILVTLLVSAAQLFCVGMLGEYMWRLFEETKRRPVYLVRRHINFSGRRDSHGKSRNPTEAKASKPGAGWKSYPGRTIPANRVTQTKAYEAELAAPAKQPNT
jgi:dolichol-phosphate mannosyltransferase